MKKLLILTTFSWVLPMYANMNWDFNSDTQGWIAREMTWSGSGQGVYTGFAQDQQEGSIRADNGYLNARDYASITNLDLSQYIGGSLSLRINDQGATTHPNMPEPLEYIFLSGTVNSQNVILGLEVPYTQDWETISISLDKSILKNLSLEMKQDAPGMISFDIQELQSLTDIEFAAFLSNVDINIRSSASYDGGPVGGTEEWTYLTQIESVSISEIPEPSAYSLILGIFTLGCVLLRRPKKK